MDRIRAKTKSGRFLKKSCGRGTSSPPPFVVCMYHPKLPLVFFTSSLIFVYSLLLGNYGSNFKSNRSNRLYSVKIKLFFSIYEHFTYIVFQKIVVQGREGIMLNFYKRKEGTQIL